MFNKIASPLSQYLIVTGNYWAFTLTDGALRMLVVLHFHSLGYGALDIALLFLFYEFFGVVTNLVGGWLGARLGLNKIMNLGLFLQVISLVMLLVPTAMLTIPWVMAAQALSGIAKDLNKMSAKSAVKQLIPNNAQNKLYQWVALLTGSKNTLKGVGFFVGAALLSSLGLQGAALAMASALFAVWLLSILLLQNELGKAKNKPKFSQLFAKSKAINYLSAARLFLFGARDLWFVVALPVYLSQQLGWEHKTVGGFFALWVIGYGVIQGLTPQLTGAQKSAAGSPAAKGTLVGWASVLTLIPLAIIYGLEQYGAQWVLIAGLLLFGVVFAINSAMHSYLIIRYASTDGTSLDVGFYYMANAMGRLIGTVLSGALYQVYGLEACLYGSALFIGISALLAALLPHEDSNASEASTHS